MGFLIEDHNADIDFCACFLNLRLQVFQHYERLILKLCTRGLIQNEHNVGGELRLCGGQGQRHVRFEVLIQIGRRLGLRNIPVAAFNRRNGFLLGVRESYRNGVVADDFADSILRRGHVTVALHFGDGVTDAGGQVFSRLAFSGLQRDCSDAVDKDHITVIAVDGAVLVFARVAVDGFVVKRNLEGEFLIGFSALHLLGDGQLADFILRERMPVKTILEFRKGRDQLVFGNTGDA